MECDVRFRRGLPVRVLESVGCLQAAARGGENTLASQLKTLVSSLSDFVTDDCVGNLIDQMGADFERIVCLQAGSDGVLKEHLKTLVSSLADFVTPSTVDSLFDQIGADFFAERLPPYRMPVDESSRISEDPSLSSKVRIADTSLVRCALEIDPTSHENNRCCLFYPMRNERKMHMASTKQLAEFLGEDSAEDPEGAAEEGDLPRSLWLEQRFFPALQRLFRASKGGGWVTVDDLVELEEEDDREELCAMLHELGLLEVK